MEKATIRDIDVKDRRVFVRVDYNVPLKEGTIRDDTRIQESLPTIQYLVDHGAKVILASHLGRPEGQVVESMSLKPVAERLSALLGKEVKMLKDCIGEEVEKAVMALKSGEVVLLENLRFHKQETKNDKEFSAQLAKLAEIYVDDAFGTAHRAHASTYGVAELLPAVSGFLLEKELKFLGKLLHNPEKPYVAILGGAKVSDKIDVIRNLLKSVDTLLIGGAMAFTFLKIQGYEVGTSRVEPEKEEEARKILEDATLRNVTIEFPIDLVVAGEMKEGVPHKVVAIKDMPSDMMGLDIGPGTVELFTKHLKGRRRSSGTVPWASSK